MKGRAGGKTKTISKGIKKIAKKTKERVVKVANDGVNLAKAKKDDFIKTRDEIIKKMDINKNGKIDVEDIIYLGLEVPTVKVDRDAFLRSEFRFRCKSNILGNIVDSSPIKAGIKPKIINEIADEVIKNERLYVSGIAAALGMPGGPAVLVAVPADIAQYYGCMLRTAQKLMYLYGFPDMHINDGKKIDSKTLSTLILCLGVMNKVAGADSAIKALAPLLGKGVEKKLLREALTKNFIFKAIKEIAKYFDITLTKKLFAEYVKKGVPIAGGVISGGISWFTFKPCCENLKKTLYETMKKDPNNKKTIKNMDDITLYKNVIYGEFKEIKPKKRKK